MSTLHATPTDEAAFTGLVEKHRAELRVHCYRMLGSLYESEDLVQETFLRAWRRRETFEGRSTIRAWLCRIATNACLDALARRPQAAAPPSSPEVPWLRPFPDRLLEEVAPSEEDPAAAIVEKETIELAFMAAIQHLPPRQRAVLILRGVLGWSARDTAQLLDTSVPSVNSALQRARRAMQRQLPARRLEWPAGSDPSQEERELLARYVEANENADADAFAAILSNDARFSMPPEPGLWAGRQNIIDAWKSGGFGTPEYSDWRCVLTRANLQPAVACYLRRPGSSDHVPLAIDVLRIEGGKVAEIMAFHPDVFPSFGLPQAL